MMDLMVFDAAAAEPSHQSLHSLDWLTFLLAGILTGFGPYVAIFLSSRHWTPGDIGLILTAGGIVGLASQVPGGELLDSVRSKRLPVAVGVGMVTLGALILALRPSFPLVLAAEVLQGMTGGFLGSAISAISLGLVGHAGLADRLGRNQRFAAAGGFTAAGLMGLLGYFISNQVIFLASAVLAIPTLVALSRIRAADIHFGRACGAPSGDYHPAQTPRIARGIVGTGNRLLIFAGCIVLFQFANASVLPLLGEAIGQDRRSSLVMSALIVVPQVVVALLAPWVGRRAESWGRRPLLLIGFGALPIRAMCFAVVSDPPLLAFIQVLDGITGAAVGVLTPLVIADITKGTGRFNLAQGIVGTCSGFGAALSTTASGLFAQSFGNAAGFSAVAVVALVAVVILWAFMPETKPADSVSGYGTAIPRRP
jgi:MFS family permease